MCTQRSDYKGRERINGPAYGALIVGVGIVVAAHSFVRMLLAHQSQSYNRVSAKPLHAFSPWRWSFNWLLIFSPRLTPSWEQTGKLATIAVIRTALNYFPTREMQEEQAGIAGNTLNTARTTTARDGRQQQHYSLLIVPREDDEAVRS